MLRQHYKKRNYYAAATAPRPEYRWCYAEQVDQAAPLAGRSNGWRYLGPREGETYRRQAVFGAGFRLRLPFPRLSPGPGHRWFSSQPLGGDPDLPDFQAWARTMLRRRLVHRDDADAWRATFVDVEGGEHGQLVVSAADETWRVILCWGSRGRRIDVDQHGIPTSLVDLQVRAGVISEDPRFRQLNIACFGHRVVRYDPLTEFGVTWKERIPGACLTVLVADSWRNCQIDLLERDRRRFGFRDVDPLTGTFMHSRAGGRSKKGVKRSAPNALDGGNSFRNLYSIMLERDVGSTEFSAWLSGEECVPAVTVRHLERWLKTTKASVVVWSHRGSGAEVVGAKGQTTSLRPRALRVGVREGHVYRLVLDGPWKDPFTGAREGAVGPSLDVAVEHCVRTRRLFRRIAEAAEEGGEDDNVVLVLILSTGIETRRYACLLSFSADKPRDSWCDNCGQPSKHSIAFADIVQKKLAVKATVYEAPPRGMRECNERPCVVRRIPVRRPDAKAYTQTTNSAASLHLRAHMHVLSEKRSPTMVTVLPDTSKM